MTVAPGATGAGIGPVAFVASHRQQGIELTPGGLPRDAGLVRYANEFKTLG